MPGVAGTMREYKKGTLHSGSKHGPKVTSRKQAIAIGLSEERRDAVLQDIPILRAGRMVAGLDRAHAHQKTRKGK
jgi:hypothetical protein